MFSQGKVHDACLPSDISGVPLMGTSCYLPKHLKDRILRNCLFLAGPHKCPFPLEIVGCMKTVCNRAGPIQLNPRSGRKLVY